MTGREKGLLRLLAIAAAGVLVLLGVQTYLDSLAALDQQFASIQKQASQVQRQVGDRDTTDAPGQSGEISRRFWAPGTVPEPLALAKRLQPILSSGLTITEFEVQESSAAGFRLRYLLRGPIESFFQALAVIASSDPKLLHRKLAVTYREAGIYDIEWEVGYAALP